jgi:hypothetical protein
MLNLFKFRHLQICVLTLFAIVCAPVAARESSVVWKQTREISAPEATQAAAADRDFVYAISSTEVAKYDRGTGKRESVSTGKAEHLNSGFFKDGKLYCAHSNYPKMPEKSEIMVLDPVAMKLTTFKDFGNFDGGSLTWAIHDGNNWWCNFAKYGKENHKTVLVKFDKNWREQARYTYPQVVIRDLGEFSLSGGIWHDGSLIVSDHDHRVVYKLRLPQEGTVLEFIEKSFAPFTGQGIAADPKTGGMVGIDRAKRSIVFAESEPATRQ